MLTLEDYFGRMSRRDDSVPPQSTMDNAIDLLNRVNPLLDELSFIPAAVARVVNSGWRTPTYNSTIPGAAPKSKHLVGLAIDIADPEGDLDDYLFSKEGQELLAKYGLYLEHPLATKGWSHIQSVAPRSGNRVFIP